MWPHPLAQSTRQCVLAHLEVVLPDIKDSEGVVDTQNGAKVLAVLGGKVITA